jgi:hypothetical protein
MSILNFQILNSLNFAGARLAEYAFNIAILIAKTATKTTKTT